MRSRAPYIFMAPSSLLPTHLFLGPFWEEKPPLFETREVKSSGNCLNSKMRMCKVLLFIVIVLVLLLIPSAKGKPLPLHYMYSKSGGVLATLLAS